MKTSAEKRHKDDRHEDKYFSHIKRMRWTETSLFASHSVVLWICFRMRYRYDIDQTNINRDIRDGNWLSSWTRWMRSSRNPVSEPGGANEANARVSRCAMIRQTGAGGKQALNATSVNSHLFIDSPHPARQSNIFANGVKFSIFTHFLCFFLLKLLKLGEIDGVKFLAWKSGGVKFWTNSMSVYTYLCSGGCLLWALVQN